MKHVLFICATALISPLTQAASAQTSLTETVTQTHILPKFEHLSSTTQTLANVAAQDCSASSAPLRTAYSDAFDAWVSASHLRFGPTEIEDRAFAIAFWPDSRGATPRALNTLIVEQDPIIQNVADYADVSIAARGFYALELLLFDDTISTLGDDTYRCQLIQTITRDASILTSAIYNDWIGHYTDAMLHPSADGAYRSDDEVTQELLKAVSTGLQFTSETRLGRPMGTFERSYPKRAEAWRAGRSARHVQLSLEAVQHLAVQLADSDTALIRDLETAFERALSQLGTLNDPVFAGVAAPQGRLRVEVLQQSINTIQDIVRNRLGPELGVAAGFNSLDGD